MYSTNNENISKIFTRTLKNKIYKFMTSVSKNVLIDKEDLNSEEIVGMFYKKIKQKQIK